MKNSAIIISLLCIYLFTPSAFAQFDIDLEKKIEKKINKELNDAADDAIDESVETIKKGGEEENTNKGPLPFSISVFTLWKKYKPKSNILPDIASPSIKIFFSTKCQPRGRTISTAGLSFNE